MKPKQMLRDLWIFTDTCNVYVVRRGDRAVAIDYGSGRWRSRLGALGIRHLDHVFLTHHHADQCFGLQAERPAACAIHAPTGEEKFLDPAAGGAPNLFIPYYCGCPSSYALLKGGIPNVSCDMAPFGDLYWQGSRIRFIPTPGHGPNACSVVLDHGGKQIVFCGDAAHARAKIWQPYHLEWDHWTGTGALAAWEGIQRLYGIGMDALCPSHGPVITQSPRAVLRTLSDRLMAFYHIKGQIAIGEKDGYVEPAMTRSGARRWLPDLFQYGNGCVLRSATGAALVVDPFIPEMPALEALLTELGGLKPTAALVSHYHADHCDGIPHLREKYGTRGVLHPWVAEPLRNVVEPLKPWVPRTPIAADELWPDRGTWMWNEYTFRVAPWPGQTWWHCVFMTTVNSQKVLFGGDSFQPASRWNGTGGFCAFNRSYFAKGFVPSAKLALRWKPDIVVDGHDTCYRFRAAKFRKIVHWARRAEQVVKALCPSGSLDKDYYSIPNLTGAYDPNCGALFWLTA
jgi:glyoxylase-like metal-dependent hydrolase (beta-lactamase superfamily II)